MTMTPFDRKLLRSLGVSPEDDPTDQHAGCMQRWLEERNGRELAERRAIASDELRAQAEDYAVGTVEDLHKWQVFAGVLAALLVIALLYVFFLQRKTVVKSEHVVSRSFAETESSRNGLFAVAGPGNPGAVAWLLHQEDRFLFHAREERLQDITEDEVMLEGIQLFDFPVPPNPPDQVQRMYGTVGYFPQTYPTAVMAFRRLWQSLHNHPGERWQDNPVLIRLAFRRIEARP